MARKFFMAITLLIWALAGRAEPVKIAVASNFYPTAKILADRFFNISRVRVDLISGSTGKLFLQIVNGAPYNVFLAADNVAGKKLVERGLALRAQNPIYARGQLALWWPGADSRLTNWTRLLPGKRLAIANPKTAPYGQMAKKLLVKMKFWEAWQPGLVYTKSVAQTFQLIESSQVQAGLVPIALLVSQNVSRDQWLPLPEAGELEQSVVLLKGAGENARAWVDYLLSEPVQLFIAQRGYKNRADISGE